MTSGAWYTAVWELPLFNLPCWAVRASQEDIHRASCRPRNPSMPSTLTQMPPKATGARAYLTPRAVSQSVSHPFLPELCHSQPSLPALDVLWEPQNQECQGQRFILASQGHSHTVKKPFAAKAVLTPPSHASLQVNSLLSVMPDHVAPKQCRQCSAGSCRHSCWLAQGLQGSGHLL